MDASDRAPFAESLSMFLSLYRDEVTDLVLDAWWGALEPYPLNAIRDAMTCHATDPDRGTYKPLVADIVLHITRTLPARDREARNRLKSELAELTRDLDDQRYKAEHDYRNGLIDAQKRASIIRAATMDIARIKADPRYYVLQAPEGGNHAHKAIGYSADATRAEGLAGERAHGSGAVYEAVEMAREATAAHLRDDAGNLRDPQRRPSQEGGREAASERGRPQGPV